VRPVSVSQSIGVVLTIRVWVRFHSQTGTPQGKEGEEGCEETEGPKGCWRSVLEDFVCPLIPCSVLERWRGCKVVTICVVYDLHLRCMLCFHALKKHLESLRFAFTILDFG